MELDERLRWFEARVTSSLKPRAEELKHLFSNEESRRCLLEFCNNEESRHLFVYFSGEASKNLIASFKAIPLLKSKALFFIKPQSAGKVTRDNINTDVFYCSCSPHAIKHLEIISKEIFLPLLSIEQTGGASADKLMDIVHRLISSLQIVDGNFQGEVSLPLPSIEVLSEAAGYNHRKLVVIHILETFLIGWIKQIKNSLKLDPDIEIARHHGKKPGPLCEAEAWTNHLERIRLINEQLCSPVIVNILMNLEEANSTYAQSFHNVKRDISKAENEADENLQFLNTMSSWFEAISYSRHQSDIIPNFAPLMHTLFLVWQHSRYFHKTNNLIRLLRMVSNEVVKKARDLMVGNVLDDLMSAHSNLKEALQICASFRGQYLDTKDKADLLNQQKLAEQVGTRNDKAGVVWHSRLFKEAKTQRGTTVFGKEKDQRSENDVAEVWNDSPWPARNSPVFGFLNSFMERCNDVGELVETTRHFRMLRNAAEVGGAGGQGLDAMVREIHEKFEDAMIDFKGKVHDMLDIDHAQQFERGFFVFRSVIRDLESRLGGVLKESFKQCWDIRSRLRLLEVFEGTSSRDLVQKEIRSIMDAFVGDLTRDVIETRKLFEKGIKAVHQHIPPLANELLWLESLKARLKVTMDKLKLVSPASLKGDDGWKLRDLYSELIIDINKSEKLLYDKWQNTIGTDLRLRLKKPLLIVRTADDGSLQREVNIDDYLREMLREVHHLQRPPIDHRLPDVIRSLIRNTDPALLQTNAARLSTVVSQYNIVKRIINDIERPLFEMKLATIEQLLKEGHRRYSWQDVEATDFIERATNLVCNDVFKNVGIVISNSKEILRIADSWSAGDLDAFGIVDDRTSMYIDELHSKQRSCSTNLYHAIEADGRRIHELLKSIFEAVQISRASPSWLAYTHHISDIVYNGLKKSVLSSLDSMLRRIANAPNAEPILTIRLELVASEITFTPPLTKSSAAHSLQEYVDDWLEGYLSRASRVASVCEDANFMEMMKSDFEIVDRIVKVNAVVTERIDECKKYLDTFKDFAFLWMQDVKFTFDEFLKGSISSKSRDQSRLEDVKSSLSNSSKKDKETYKSSSRGSSAVTAMGTIAFSERTMLAVKRLKLSKEDNAPSLDDFDRELEVYRGARDQIHAVIESCEVGWIKVNMQPIKKTIQTYASKWVFTFTKYLTDQVSSTLNDLDAFLKRIEPGVEAITGEERDIISFMRLMRIFNEVTAQQSELDTKFATMKRTLTVLEKYEQKLPETTQKFYAAAPLRWNNLKMKVNQAKKRLGPRIQAEAMDVTRTLRSFGERCNQLDYEFRSSDAFNRTCFVYNAHNIMDSIEKSLNVIESEAQDLVELQELLEEDIVDFTVLPSLRSDLGILRQVWETTKLIHEQQTDWKRHRWQKIRPKLLRKLLNQQEDMVKQLPDNASHWDVSIGLQQSIQLMMSCVPIMEDLNKAAMRTRHWKQLVRATGGAVNISSDDLTKMNLGQFMHLGLQNHADEVHGVIQRAAKDVCIEKALKTYEEVWLSKTFELVKHTRLSTTSTNAQTYDTPASEYGNESDYAVNTGRPSGSRVSLTSMGLRVESRQRSASIFSSSTPLRQSVLNFVDQGEVHLLNNVEPILEELELHQLSLQSMFGGSAASSFADDIIKWEKTLQNLEAVLVLWWEAQQKWIKLDDVYNGTNFRIGLPKETNLFASSSNDFRHILKVTEKNPNVLQICSREDIHTRLEKINSNFESCLKALMNHLEGRKQKFPRLYLLSQEDVLDIVCKGYDPGQINPYLSKILRNGCLLDYELQEMEEKKFYQITGIRSVHGEVLTFVKPVDCDSVVENWLSSVTNAIKLTLKTRLASELGMLLPESLHTAVSPTLELVRQNESETKVKSPQRKVIFAAETGTVQDLEDTARTDMNLQSSWSQRNINEIVILALLIELTKKFEKSFEGLESGNKNAIESLHQHLTAILQSAARLLQGADESSGLHEVIDLNEDIDLNQPNLESHEQEVNIKDHAGPDENEAGSKTEKNIVLLPNEIQKLTNLVFILSRKRDLAKRLSNMITSIDQNENEGERQLSKTFEWQSQLKYYWSQPNATCRISVMDFDCEYGFEYQGTAARMVTTPESERALFWASQGFAKNSSCLIIGSSLCGKEELILELSNAFGYPAYKFVCSEALGTRRLAEIFKGIASTGSWVIFQNINRLSSSAMSVITQLISNVSECLKAKKTSALSLDEEIALSPNSKIFATLELSKCFAEARTFQLFPRIASSLYSLPSELLAQFRPVCLSTPDMLCVLKMHLIVCGFTFAEELANDLANIHSTWSSLSMATAAPSLKVLCSLIADAGDHLNKVLSVESVQKMTDVEIGKVVNDDTSSQGSSSLILSATEAVLVANSPEKVDEINDAENADYDAISEKSEPVNLQSDEHMELDIKSIEQRSIVLALRSTITPSLSGADAVMFATLIGDYFPALNVQLVFDDVVGDENEASIADETIGLSLEKEKEGAPLHSLPNSPQPKDQALRDFESAVHIAVQRLELLPGNAFVTRVVQLSQLVSTHKTVIVVGPPGCGKTACIRSLIAAQREMGHNIIYDSMYLGVSESEELFGHKRKSGGWIDGFMPSVLRKKLHDICKSEIGMTSSDSRNLRWIHLDGKVDSSQMRFLLDVLTGDDDVTLPNSERVHLPATIRFIWEIDILDNICASLLSNSGILSMNTKDVGWRLVMRNWLSKQPDSSREILTELCRRYIQTTIDFLVNEKIIRTDSEMQKTVVGYYHTHGQMQHAVSLSNLQIVKNLFSIYEALIFNAQEPTSESFENFFNFSAFWAFGGNLIKAHREHFSNWWKDKWSEFVAYPEDVSLWQCKVHPETHEFIDVADVLPVYARKPNSSFSADAHVATVQNMVTSHLVAALAEAGKPTLLIGPSGCGKSHIIKDRLISNSSDMAEVQSLFINANKFITAKTLWQRMDDLLEWKHTKTFVPKGNKRLICLIDDINYCHSSDSGSQSACETIRQLLDENGSFYYKGWKWRDIHDVTYLATYNPWNTVSTPPISNRLLNKWVVIYFPYPCEEETRTIFGTLIKTHFIPPLSLTNVNQDGVERVLSSEIIRKRSNEAAMRKLLTSIVAITVEVQEHLRSMFLPTPERSHYIFTLNNLCILFRNLCLALRSSCSPEDLILLWKHECEHLYGAILIDQVDKERWVKAFYTAARKRLDKSQLEIVTRPSCLVSTLVDMDDTTKKGSKNIVPSSESEEPAIAYRPIYDETKAKVILEHNINEHNKDNPKVKIYLYPDTVKMISRLIRILQSPHECGHAMVLANGFPGLPLPMVKIAAYICGFTVFQIQPSTLVLGEKYAIEHFKLDIVNAYTTAGLKGEKLLFALNETELYDEDFLVYITEFLVSNSISHLFNEEEHTSITNAIRTDVTQAGLSYTKETAWNFFLKTVRENLRFVFILSSVEDKFPKRCRQFPGMINAMQILPLPHWTKDELVSCVLYHLIEVKIFNETEKENIAHLLASMHLAISESGGTGKKSGKFRHVTNTTFERFVEFFVDLAERRHAEIEKEYDMIFKTLEAIKRGSELANQLKSQLEHEKIVLEQKKQGNFTLLSQIGQDKAITEEQVRLVRKQQWKIDKLEKLLPRYQDSHERAVFKAAAMVKETKHILAVLDQQGLSDLRSMQKPDSDVEDVLASVIIIIKSPTSDLTWNKGAKRIMANLERFRDDLAAFDEVEMTEETLQVVEPYIKRPHFGSGFMEKKTSNIALESLVSWVRGVVKYHRMMLSRVKPLHKMVEQTRSALDEAVEKLGGMESKLRNLDNRMLSLSEKFEDASVDKSKQGLLTEEQQRQLAQAADFERLLASGTEQWMLVLESISNRRKSMVGSAAVSAGFATYLGPCNYQFRQTMIEKVWMECLRERGIAADTKIADNLTVNITMSMSTLSIANSVDAEDVAVNLETEDVEEQRKESEEEKSQNNEKNEGEARDEESKALTEQSSARIEDVQENEDKVSPQSSSKSLVDKQMEEVQSLISTGGHSYYHYDQHLLAHLMLLSGNGSQRNWISKGLNYRQLEEASIFVAAVQTPLFIIDPYNRAMQMLDIIASDMVKIDMTQRNSTILNTIEKSVTAGDTLVIYNVENEIDSFLFPIIDHINTKSRLHMDEETSVVKINGRRLLIHPSFQLILIHSSPYPIIHEELASTMTVIDLRPNANGIVRHFLLSAVERVRPALCTEDNKIYYELFQCYDTLGKLDNDAMALIRRKQGAGIWEETELITDIVMKRSQMAARFSQVILNLQRMHFHRAKFVPLAKCVSSAFNILSSLSSLRSEYQFPFDFIVSLFELATGGKENEQSSKLIYVSVDCDKPKSRTPANKRKDEKSMKNASELLGVNLDKITHMLAADGKEFNDFKGAEIIKPVSELLVVDGPNELPEELQIDVPPTEDDVATDVPEMCKEFFRIFYKHVSKSLSSEHHSLFTLLCWLRMKITDFAAPDPDSIGMLLEKNCSKEQVVSESKCPSWLPLESLNLLVSFSASFPSVTSVTESIATESNSWYSWYIDPAPETLPLPMTLKEEDAPVKDSVTTTDDQHEDKEESKDDQAIETESVLHGSEAFDQQSKDTTKLLVIKCLRPDRFHNAITTLCASDFNEFQRQIDYNFDELMSCTCDPKPVLILLPSSKDETDGIDDRKTFTASYGADVLAQKAKEKGLNLIQAHVFDGNEKMINLSLNNAVSTENWILIEDLHLGEANWLREFTKRVARLHEQSDPKMQWRIIMTTEPCDKLPLQLLYLCEKISLDALVAVNEKLSFFNLSEESSIIKKNIVIALKCPNEQLWTGSREKSLVHRDLLYTLCVAHGIMLSRQVFTPRTFTLKPRITCEDLLRSTEYASKYFESTVEKINLSLKDICQVICEDIYCGKAINDTDKNYIRMIFSCISNGLSSNLGSAIQFGTCSIAIPPANVDPLDYPNWFIDKAGPSEGESLTLEFMHLDEVNGRNINEQRSTAFIEELRQLYEATLDEPFSTTCGTNKSAEWIKLRQSIDLCKEKLPSLLKIDDCFGMTFSDIRQNPQLRSLSPFSEKSLLLSQKEELSTSISYCLLKECQWLNQLLFKISSSIDDLAKALISGMHAIPNCYKNILEPLNNSRVPDEWIHGHSDCKLKTLTDWLNDLSRAHSQLNAWLKRGVVPKPTSEPTIGRGNLELVDLRLLRNPGGLIDSLKYTTAISNGVKLSEVPLKCYFSKRQSKLPSVPPGLKSSDGVILSGLFIEGASWDMENGLLLEQQNAAEKLPYVFVTTDIRSTRDETAVFHCPVFMNRFRQDMLFTLPLPLTSNEDVDKFYLKGVYIMLDPLPVKV